MSDRYLSHLNLADLLHVLEDIERTGLGCVPKGLIVLKARNLTPVHSSLHSWAEPYVNGVNVLAQCRNDITGAVTFMLSGHILISVGPNIGIFVVCTEEEWARFSKRAMMEQSIQTSLQKLHLESDATLQNVYRELEKNFISLQKED